jgi:outer membrane receptor protein involved in Fe transport
MNWQLRLYSAMLLALQVQTANSQELGSADGDDLAKMLDTVTVTAQRRVQAAQDVGIALSVLDGGELLEKGVSTVNDLQHVTPSLEVEPAFGGGQPQFRLRGVGFQDYAANNSPTVGIYVNEVAYPVPAMTQGLLFDLQRVEILRGPQGTLYGRNTTGGADNFITNRPTDDRAEDSKKIATPVRNWVMPTDLAYAVCWIGISVTCSASLSRATMAAISQRPRACTYSPTTPLRPGPEW